MQQIDSGEILAIVVISLLFGLATIHVSLEYGQLALPTTYDDNGYFIDAARRLAIWANGTVTQAIRNFIVEPPHAPFSTLACATAFLLFGITSWAPAALNILWIAVLLFVVRRMLKDLPFRWFVVTTIACLSWTLMSFVVIESRPDLFCAALTAFGAFAIVQRNWLRAGSSFRMLSAVVFAVAMLAKPSISPLTLATFVLCVFLSVVVEAREGQERGYIRRVAAATVAPVALFVGICALYGPYGWISAANYIRFTTHGSHTSAYFGPDDYRELLRFYLTGAGGRAMMGAWIWVCLAIFCLTIAAQYRDKVRVNRDRCIAVSIVVLFLFFSVSLTRFQSIYLGVVVSWVLFILFVQSLVILNKHWNPRAVKALLIILAVFGTLQFHSHWQRKSGRNDAVNGVERAERARRLSALTSFLVARCDGASVFFTGSELHLNAVTLNLELVKAGCTKLVATEINYADSLTEYMGPLHDARYVVTFAPSDGRLVGGLPSTKWNGVTWEALKTDEQFEVAMKLDESRSDEVVVYRRR